MTLQMRTELEQLTMIICMFCGLWLWQPTLSPHYWHHRNVVILQPYTVRAKKIPPEDLWQFFQNGNFSTKFHMPIMSSNLC